MLIVRRLWLWPYVYVNIDIVPFGIQKFVSQRDLILSATVDRLFTTKCSYTLESFEGPDSAYKEALGRYSF